MFLKSLTIRGFKSFADKTSLAFERGVSVVVGPNGSGKSNICDSISWVLGEQGPRSLRGGKMEDVIFAGSPMRPALGMAEVSLVIDNSAGILPIEFSEVTVSRTLLRSGDSEYRLNGQACRLLDIQELLSDTGVGREQHTIIGQGQLDDILTADADQMRGFIEEAAGVSKHRRRKERALRKLASSEQNLTRLSDMLREVRRTLRPLREQAEMARRHSEAAAELSRVRLVLLARELAVLRGRLGGDLEDLDAAIRFREERMAELEDRLRVAEAAHSKGFGDGETAREAAWRLTRQAERLESLERFAGERGRALEAELAATTEEAARARVAQLSTELADARERLAAATAERASSEAEEELEAGRLQETSEALSQAEESVAAARREMRALADEEVRLRGEIAALQASIDAAWQEEGRAKRREARLQETLDSARSAAEQAAAEVAALEESEGPHVEAIERADGEIAGAAGRLDDLQERLRAAERDAAFLEALAGRASRKAARRAAEVPGVLGVLSDLVEDPGDRELLRTVLGDTSGIVVASSAGSVAAALEAAAGEPLVVLAPAGEGPVVEGARPLMEALTSTPPTVRSALSGFFLVDDLSEGLLLAERHPGAVFAVAGGPVIFRGMVSSSDPNAAGRAREAGERVERVIMERSRAEEELRAARDRREEESKALNQLDAQIAAAAERLSGAEREAHGLEREAVAISEARAESERSASLLQRRLGDLEGALPQLSKGVREAEATLEKSREDSARALGEREIAARALEEARLTSARTWERVRLAEEQTASTTRALESARAAAGEVEGSRERLRAAIVRTSEVAEAAAVLKTEASAWADEAEAAYQQLREMLEGVGEEIGKLRSQRASMAVDLDEMRTKAREEDLGMSEARIRSKIIEEKMREEGADPEEIVERFGERLEVEDPSRIEDPLARQAASDEAALRRREGRLTSDLSRLGAVNPLAEQEFDALGDREQFLEEQIGDVRKSRRDLFRLVSQIDVRIREMFAQAFRDVADEYERLFALLFPGGMGRLRLTDPNELLEAGIEVEARPGGKNLRRLSLLSGGEKALSALAFLFAIFRARPSPFYVLDEVEAALDDVNLHRFLTLIKEFRTTSQLIVVTHQKRTMEAADVLYGVSISPDGASRVISQRLSDAPATLEEMAARPEEEASSESS